jgi:hypothetical protein
MPAKPPKPDADEPTFRSIPFRREDDANVAKIQATLKRLNPSRRNVPITEVVSHALAVAAEQS